MLLSLNMADWVDQTFVKVYFHKMTMEYSNWLVRKIRDKETNMASMRKQFPEDNEGRQGDNNYEFKRRDKDDKVLTTDGTNEQSKKKKLKQTWFFYFLALNIFI